MQILTPEKINALEMFVGVRVPQTVLATTLNELIANGLLGVDPYTGAVLPTDEGVRATAPQHMKEITP